MAKIIIELPDDRAAPGSILLVDSADKIVAGPFPALGRASRKSATSKGNPGANRLQLYGDTPYGTYAVVDIVPTGDGTDFDAENYGSEGAIRLRPLEGEAELAARAGRTGLLIHGGVSVLRGRVRPTSGSVRIANGDMKSLLEGIALVTLNESPPAWCEVRKGSASGSLLKDLDEDFNASDPPVGMKGDWHLSELLRARHPEAYIPDILGGALAASQPRDSQEGHDREIHDREVHDREMHDREVHDREIERETPHDRASEASERGDSADTHDRTPATRKPEADTHDRSAAARTSEADTHDRTAAGRASEADTHDRSAAARSPASERAVAKEPDPPQTHDRTAATKSSRPADTHDRSAPQP